VTSPSTRRRAAFDIVDGLVERQHVGDAIAGERIDDEAPLLLVEHLLRRVFQVEDAIIEGVHGIGDGDLHMKTRLGNDPDRFAEADHQGLSGLMDGEEGPIRPNQCDGGDSKQECDKFSHRLPPAGVCCAWAGAFRSSGSGR
jgi:hypothetical protein